MRRALRLLALSALLVTAGCLSAVGPGTSSPGTESPDPTETPYPTPAAECDAYERETVDPYRDDVEPSPFPELPSNRTAASVESHVVAFEEAYSRNEALFEDSKRVATYTQDVSVRRVNGTWVVDLVSVTNTWAQGPPTDGETATVVHGDGPRVPVRYHLSDDGLYRNELDYDETPVPGEYGRAVACYE